MGKQKGDWFHIKFQRFQAFSRPPVIVGCSLCGRIYAILRNKKTGEMMLYPRVINYGKMKVKCEACGYIVYIPEKMLRISCPRCGKANNNPKAYEKQVRKKD